MGDGESQTKVLAAERERIQRLITVLFERHWSNRHQAYKNLSELIQKAILDFEHNEMQDARSFVDNLRALIETGSDPNTWVKEAPIDES